jgi:Holliday junction DNA helicase RuvA
MIHQVRGKVVSVDLLGAVIDVSGFGVYLHMAEPETLLLESEATLLTHLAVNQNGIELYGFMEKEDLAFFTQLLDVPGVGPKTALGILRKAPRPALMRAIGTRDLDYLTKVAGLGKKAAEKILVELSEKVGDVEAHDDSDSEVFETLVALGYTEREARVSVGKIPKTVVGKEARLKSALSETHTK